VALLVAGFIVIWPVLRAIWWWATEIATALLLVWGWVQLAEHTTLVGRITALVLIIGPLAAIGPVRRQIIAVVWCVIVRHRLRTCFSEFIITNRTGSLPLILWARPTAVGVRVWIWLRPGLALEDVQTRLDLIAVACWSTSATAEATSGPNSAHIRLDIKRRNALARNLGSPLASVAASPHRDTTPRDMVPVPGALDLPDVSAADIAPAKATRADSKAPATVPVIRTVPAATTNGDIEDWI
jgi:hypothetical protein